MKTELNNILAEADARYEYIINNDDYSSRYDINLDDDSTYHSEKWENTITSCIDLGDIGSDIMEQIINSILSDPEYYLYRTVKDYGFVPNNDDSIIASFNIQSEETTIDLESNAFINGKIEWLNKNSDYYFHTIINGTITCEYNLTYVQVEYRLKRKWIKKLYSELLIEQQQISDVLCCGLD